MDNDEAGDNMNDKEDKSDDSDDNLENDQHDIIIQDKEIQQISAMRLCVISSLGGLDDFSVQLGFLLANVFTWYQLLTGTFVGSIVTIFCCLSLSYIKPIAKVIKRVPVWFIILSIAVYRLTVAIFETS